MVWEIVLKNSPTGYAPVYIDQYEKAAFSRALKTRKEIT